MKILNKKNNKKTIIIIAIAVVLLVPASVFAYSRLADNQTSNTQETKDTNRDSDNKSDDSTTPYPDENKSNTNTDPQAPTSTDNTSGKTIVTVVTSANVSNGTVYIRGGLNNQVDADGTCYALLVGPTGTSIRKDTTLLQNASTVDCKTIQIPTSELSTGLWKYTLNYSSSVFEGTSSENTFSI